MEICALSYSGVPKKLLQRIERLNRFFKQYDNCHSYLLSDLKFTLTIAEGIAYTELSDIGRALKQINFCSRLLRRRKLQPTGMVINLATLYSYLKKMKKAEYWFLQALSQGSEEEKNSAKYYLVDVYFSNGNYKTGIRLLNESKQQGTWVFPARENHYKSMTSLFQGHPYDAMNHARRAISFAKKEEIANYLVMANFMIACAYGSLGMKQKGIGVLRRILSYEKKGLSTKSEMFRVFITPRSKTEFNCSTTGRFLPTIKLGELLKYGQYNKAVSYATRNHLIGYLYRYVFFFPQPVIRSLEQGKSTNLPKPLLRLPVFNRKAPVYNIRLLGDLVVYKNQRYLKVKVLPKDMAFVVHLALKIGDPGKKILPKELYDNFWSDSSNPARNLSLLLLRIKKILKIPAHLLEISHRGGESVLINRGIHFITDYSEFEQALVTAHAFERADEWEFARKEYLHAFKLFRGEPFKRMYDNWSEQMRRVILNRLETEAIHFAGQSLKQHSKADAKKVLEKAARIISGSEEIRNMVNKLG